MACSARLVVGLRFGDTRAEVAAGSSTRRSPMTFSVISCTVASTPPMPRGAVSSGTGL